MIKNSYTLFTLFGIPVKIDLSLIVLVFFVLSSYGRDPMQGIAFCGVLLFSIVFHEFAHSLVAMAFGGRVRDITLLMFGGAASITQMPRKPWQQLLMAAAGPLSSLALAVVGIAMLFGGVMPILGGMLISLNIMLAFFNLIPAFPMDGGRILCAALEMAGFSKLKAVWVASRIGKGIAVFWVAMSLLSFLNATPLPPAGLPAWANFLWYIVFHGSILQLVIAFMIYQAAEAEYRATEAASFHWHNQRPQGPQGCSPFAAWLRRRSPQDSRREEGVHEAVISPPPYEKDGRKRVVPLDHGDNRR